MPVPALQPTIPRPRGASPERLRVLLAAEDERPADREAIRVGIVGGMLATGEWTEEHAAVLWERPDGAELLRRAKAWMEDTRA